MIRLLLLVTALGVGLFAYENPGTINVYFGGWAWERVPLWYPVVAGVLVVLLACLMSMWAGRRRWRAASRHMRQAQMAYEELLSEHDVAIAELQLETQRLRQQMAHWDGLSSLRTG